MRIIAENKNRVVGLLCLMGLMIGASCVRTAPTRAPTAERERRGDDVFTIFFTGNVLGALRPCGCSGGQLGGLSRRSSVLNTVPIQRRLAVDTGSFVKSDIEQDLIKYHSIIQALQLLDYDLVNLSEKDIEIGGNLGLLEGIELIFNIISPHSTPEINVPAKFTKKFSLKGRTSLATIAAFDPESTSVEQIKKLFDLPAGVPTLNILILNNRNPGTIESIAKAAPFVDCIICPSESDEPAVIGNPNKHPLAITVGRFGRYICELKVTAPARVGQPLRLSFNALPVEEGLPKEDSLVKLYEDYQLIVKDRNLLEKHPRFALPDDLEYAGSQACISCHKYEYEKWSGDAHAHAYATLEGINSQFDPECVTCHVIGLEYESGFVSQEATGHLKNVGCENCHGPGSEHVKTLGKAKFTEPKSACADCHTPEHSGNYPGNERQYAEKIRHWR